MSVSIVHTRAQLGVTALSVSVETHISNGLPSLSIVGMPETSVRESRERVRSALINAGFEFPTRRVTINLAPADLPKQGGRYDLAIAIGILLATGQLPGVDPSNYEFIGELALTGVLRPVSGVLPGAIASAKAKRTLVMAVANASEAAISEDTSLLPAHDINQLCNILLGREEAPDWSTTSDQASVKHKDLKDVVGQQFARRALEVAAAGGLNLLFYGPPGTGKTMLASRLTGILPPLTKEEALEVCSVYSVSGRLEPLEYALERPFRSPHHSASPVALIGGGSAPKPGEVSLAHHGVLYLDELPEYDRKALEMLREPIESGYVMIARANRSVRFPASFQLVAAMNPCPCGYLGHPKIDCQDSPQQIQHYRRKLSGPLLDRFDMHVEVGYQSGDVLLSNDKAQESSAQVKQRVIDARERQSQRQGKANSRLDPGDLQRYCPLSPDLNRWLESVMEKLALSARAAHRIIRLARTIADLAGDADIQSSHLAEAVAYRSLDRQRSQ